MGRPSHSSLPSAVVLGAVLMALVGVLLFAKIIPLGIPGEWVWPYWPPEVGLPVAPLTLAPAVLLGVLAFTSLRAAGRRPLRRWETGLALGGITLSHAGLLIAAVAGLNPSGTASLPAAARMGQLVASPTSFGYYVAALEAGDARTLLETHEETMADPAAPERVRTHPPGPALVYLAINSAFDSLPYSTTRTLEGLLGLARLPGDALAAAVQGPYHLGLSGHEALGAVVCGYVTALIGALVVLPLFLLGREVGGPRVGLVAAALYALTPSALIFVPAIDHWITGLAVTCLWLIVMAARRGSIALAAVAGAVFWLALQVSFGAIALVPLSAIIVFLLAKSASAGKDAGRADAAPNTDGVVSPRSAVRPGGVPWLSQARAAAPLLALLVAVPVVLSLLVWALTSYNAFHAFTLSRLVHAEVTARRTYWPWLATNLLDFSFGFGVCATVCLVAAARHVFADLSSHFWRAAARPETAVFLAALATLLLLDLSGTVRGEVARIWQFLMPLLLIVAAAWLERASARFALSVVVVLGCQLAQTLAMQANVAFMIPW